MWAASPTPSISWHWPLLVFGTLYKGRSLTYFQGGALLIVAFILAALSLKYVETPLRHAGSLGGKRSARLVAGVAAMCLTLAVGIGVERAGGGFFGISPEGARAEAAGDDASPFSRSCNNYPASGWDASIMKPARDCSVGPGRPKGSYDVVVWGDSHAGASFNGIANLVASLGHTARLQTMAGCPSLIGGLANREQVAPYVCAAFNAGVLEEIRKIRPKVVVLVGRWSMWTSKASSTLYLTSDEVPGGDASGSASSTRVFAHMLDRTLKELRDIGVEVIITGQTPEYARAPGRCVAEREFYGRPLGICIEQSKEQALRIVGPANDMIAKATAAHPGTSAVLLSDVFCEGAVCRAADGERYFYVDRDHLSGTGSQALGEDPGLRAALERALGAGGNTSSAALAR